MYIRPAHAEHDIPTLHAFIRENALGVLTTAIASPTQHFLQSSHIPWLLDEGGEKGLGILRGHIARANPQAQAMIADLTSGVSRESAPRLQHDVLVLFTAPAQHYVTPKFYTSTKPATGKVVPTWDYAAVQAYGRATVYFDVHDPGTGAFLARQVAQLSDFAERDIMRYDAPWSVADAPQSYIALMKKAIVGIEIEITDIAGRWKMGQELPAGDRAGVVRGFEELGTPLALSVAQTVQERAELAEARKGAQA